MTTGGSNKCVDPHSDNLFRFILKNMQNTEQAKDVVQEAFTRLWTKRNDVSGEKAKSYLFTTAYNCMVDEFRQNKKFKDENEPDSFLEPVSNSYSDLSDILNEACRLLPEVQRSAILLRDYEGYSYQEIGKILKLNESQVKVYIFRARKFLKNYIGQKDNVI